MIPVVAVPNIQMAPPIQVGSFAGVPTETSMNRIPFNAVPSPLSSPESYNNTKPLVEYKPSAAARIADMNAQAAQTTTATQTGAFRGDVSSPSTSLFMTQVMSQGGASDNGLIQSFFTSFMPSSPTPQNDLLERFAMSKYMPSQAAKPAPQPTGTAQLAPQPSAQATQSNANAQTVNVAVAQKSSAEVANLVQIQTTAPMTTAQNTMAISDNRPMQGPRQVNQTQRGAPSLVKPQGFNAYLATLSRNVANLDAPGTDPIRISL